MTAPALTFTCGNCALDWPEPYCSLCGKQLTSLTFTPSQAKRREASRSRTRPTPLNERKPNP